MQQDRQQLRWLKIIAVLGPIAFLAAIELVRAMAGPGLLRAWPGYVLFAGIILVATLFFAEAIFGAIDRMQQSLYRQNRELIALHNAGLAITSELQLERVLQRVVDEARDLGGARYGALSLLGPTGTIESFLTSGITAEERERMGPIPTGHGLLAVVIDDGEALRLPDLARDPRSVGFPPEHPPMHSLLAVPIMSRGQVLGSLYLTEKREDVEFSEADEEQLQRFATQAAIAIENANLHGQVQSMAISQERERIAREMHDTVAQVLGYVNTKAQAAQEHLRQERTGQAEEQIAQLSAASREAYADLREAILGLRTTLNADLGLIDALRRYLDQWEAQSQIHPELILNPGSMEHPDLDPLAELQVLRIIQEALANVRKHAGATRARITVTQSPRDVQVTVEDDGRGFVIGEETASEFPRFGLSTMRERAESVKGTLQVASSPGEGTTVTVRVPRISVP